MYYACFVFLKKYIKTTNLYRSTNFSFAISILLTSFVVQITSKNRIIMNKNINFSVIMLYLRYIVCGICFYCSQISGQTNMDWITAEQQAVLKAMKLDYTLPDGFTGTKYEECFDSISQFDWMLPCVSSHIISQDKHFHTSLVIYNLFSRSNDDYIAELWRNVYYSYKDKIFGESLENYVRPDNDVKIFSNADTVIICSLVLNEGNRYLNKYNHCDVIYYQKKNRGFIGLYCFYDDIAVANLDKYMQEIKRVFRYKDGEIEISDILAPEGTVVIGRPTKKKAKKVETKEAVNY